MLKEFKPVLKNKNFIYLWLSQILSQITISIINFLMVVRIYSETGSTIATSLLWIFYALPAVLIGPIAAASVDFVAKRKILMVTNLLQSATIFFYAFMHDARFFLLFWVVFIYAFLNQFYLPAEQSSLPFILPKKHLPQANSLFFITPQASLIIGFGISGILNKLIGFENSLFLCSALLFLAFISVYFLPELKSLNKLKGTFEESIFDFFKQILNGYKFIKENKFILSPFVVLLLMNTALTSTMITVPALAKDVLKIQLNSAGVLIVVPGGIGASLGAVIISKLLKKGWRKKRAIELFLTLLVFSVILFIFVIPYLNYAGRIIMTIISAVLLGVSYIGIVVPTQTFLQEATPGGLRGRVFGNFWFLATIFNIIPILLSGAIVEVFGVRVLYTLIGAIFVGILITSKKYSEKLLKYE